MKRLNQHGAVSIISVVIFITIITIIVSAYLVSAISQQRNAVNFDMGTRAYYAAESGVQDAVRYISANPTALTNKTDCAPLSINSTGQLGDTSNSKDYGVSYTCQLVTSTPTEIAGKAIPNELTAMFKLSPQNASVTSPKLVVRWSSSTSPSNTPGAPGGTPAQTLVPRSDGLKTLPQMTNWKDGNDPYHAMLRVNIISHPKGRPFGGSEVKQHVVFLNPTGAKEPLTINQNGTSPSQGQMITNAECVRSSNPAPYSCQMEIALSGYTFGSGMSGDEVYIRIGAIYKTTNFTVQLLDDTTPLVLTNAQAAVDVTGRAKDVYRRVKQTYPIKGGYFEDTGPDAAVVAGQGICKLFSVTDKADDFSSACNPLLPTP